MILFERICCKNKEYINLSEVVGKLSILEGGGYEIDDKITKKNSPSRKSNNTSFYSETRTETKSTKTKYMETKLRRRKCRIKKSRKSSFRYVSIVMKRYLYVASLHTKIEESYYINENIALMPSG